MLDGEWSVFARFLFEFAMRTMLGFQGVDKEVEVRGECCERGRKAEANHRRVRLFFLKNST